MHYVMKAPNSPTFEKCGITGRVFLTEEVSSKAGFFIVETEFGHQTTIIQHHCDFSYYVLQGRGTFVINGVEYECAKDDLIVIPEGTQFTYRGTLRMFAVSIPPWSEEQEETLRLPEQSGGGSQNATSD